MCGSLTFSEGCEGEVWAVAAQLGNADGLLYLTVGQAGVILAQWVKVMKMKCCQVYEPYMGFLFLNVVTRSDAIISCSLLPITFFVSWINSLTFY